MKRSVSPLVLAGFLLGLLALAGQAPAATCTIDAVPAATLLLPYFEVDLSKPGGITTLFTVNNASPNAVLTKVEIWTDLGVALGGFNLYLTGYDVQSVNLADVLLHGTLPQTASAGQDPKDLISPKGPFSQDINYASCAGQLPPPPMPAAMLQHFQLSLTGKFSPVLNGVAALDHGDNIARGYLTVETVNNCTLRFPGDVGYFASGGTGDATDQNVLLGDYFYIDAAKGKAQGFTMVHVEANPTAVETSVAGRYTFYGHFVSWTAADNREPLASTFFARFLNKPSSGMSTDLIVWRDPKLNQSAFKAGSAPTWYPLNREAIVVFDEQEHAVELDDTSPVPLPFAAVASRTTIGTSNLPVPFDFGWIYLNLNTLVIPAGSNPPFDPEAAQAWVTSVMTGGIYTMGFDAFRLDSTCAANHLNPHP